jgi:uncharacterized protein (TIGR03382 family)
VPPTQPITPTVDPLGASCSAGDCPGTYQCYSASGTPPGICVPPCSTSSASSTTCPDHYACDETLKVCTPRGPTVTKSHVSTSCALGAAPHTGGGAFAAALLLGAAWLSRRRQRCA